MLGGSHPPCRNLVSRGFPGHTASHAQPVSCDMQFFDGPATITLMHAMLQKASSRLSQCPDTSRSAGLLLAAAA